MAGLTPTDPREPQIPGWSPGLLRTLASVFDTLAPMPPALAERRARLAAGTLHEVTDPDQEQLLRLAIRALDWPVVMALTTGRRGRFSRMDAVSREAVLRAWSRHPVPQLRTAFQALKRVALFYGYADPGDDGQGPERWAEVGYRPPAPVEPPPPSITPLRVEPNPDPLRLEADAIIVGSGAGGGVTAARLAAAGLAVVVVEAGPYLPERAMPTLEAEAMRRLYLDQGSTSTADLGVMILAGACLGGGTTINWTTSLAPPDWLRNEWDRVHGLHGLAGDEGDADLARLRTELDLQPPTVLPPKDQAILDGAAALGWEAAPNERNAGPCRDCGACGFGCRAGSKRSGLRAHLATAARAGARVLVDARVDRVLLRAGAAAGVSGTLRTDDGTARFFRIEAPQVVVAAGPLRTPLLLQASGIAHPQLGRNLRLHPAVGFAAELADPVEMWLGPTQAARSLQFARPGPSDPAGIGPANGGFIIESAPAHPGLLASASPWDGAAAFVARMARSRRTAPFIAILRDHGSGRVRWTRHRRARIDYRLAPDDARTARRALVELARLARAAGAERATALVQPAQEWSRTDGDAAFDRFLRRLAGSSTAPNRLSLFSAHQMGTARAGADPVLSPCDPQGRVRMDTTGRIVPGLVVADGSLAPSAPGVNPMVTIMLLAERSARAVLAGRAARGPGG